MPSQSPLNWKERSKEKTKFTKTKIIGKEKSRQGASLSLGTRMQVEGWGLASQSSDLIGQQDSKQVLGSAMRGSRYPKCSMECI